MVVWGCAGMVRGSRYQQGKALPEQTAAGVQRPPDAFASFSAGGASIETNPRALSRLSTTEDPLVALE